MKTRLQMKKRTSLTLLLLITHLSTFGQLKKEFNSIRSGDMLIKQQVEYKSPGKAGIDILWDFRNLKTINEEYTISYTSPPLQGDSIIVFGNNIYYKKDLIDQNLIIATEHNTMYYYQIKNDTLFQLGYENPSIKAYYSNPIIIMPENFDFGQVVNSNYESNGIYSGSEKINYSGEIKTQIDASGKMILPSGDTLNSVLRVKTTQFIFNYKDSSTTQKTGSETEYNRWYSKGYRYPVFETVKNINLKDSTVVFATAFYFPPQEHYYLDKDPNNLAQLDSIWNNSFFDQFPNDIQISNDFTKSCIIYPNPVDDQLTVKFKTSGKKNVRLMIYNSTGQIYKKIDKGNLSTGYYTEIINCSDLPSGIYLIKITIGDQIINNKIIKK